MRLTLLLLGALVVGSSISPGLASLLVCAHLTGLTDPVSLPFAKVADVYFLDELHGYAQVEDSPNVRNFETFDGGKSWRLGPTAVLGFRRNRAFANQEDGWSIVENAFNKGEVFVTHDGGLTWTVSLRTGTNEFSFGGLQAITSENIWVVGSRCAYCSMNGGNSWKECGPPGTGLQFIDSSRGWILGDRLWQTEDGGRSWHPVESEGRSTFGGNGFFFLNPTRAWAVGGSTEGKIEGGAETGLVSSTDDGGRSTKEFARVPGQFFWSVYFIDERRGWVGGIGTLLKTEDGGKTWFVP